jgi:hypothetical protein
MSLGETQQIFGLLSEIDRLLSDIQVKVEELNAPSGSRGSISSLEAKFSQLERVGLRWAALASRFGLPENVDRALRKITQLVSAFRMAQLSAALMLAGGPAGVAMGIAGMMMAGMTMGDALAGY